MRHPGPRVRLEYGVRTAATSGSSRSHVNRGESAPRAIRAAWPRSPPTSPITCCPTFPVRQWVLSLPKRLRPYLHHNPNIAGAVLRIFIRAVRTTLCRTSPGAPSDAQLGALSFLHRFGATLNTHFHFHVVVLDGVFSQAPDGEARFHEATGLTPEHWLEFQHVVQRRVLRYFRTHGLLDEADAHGMLSWQGSGGFSIDASVRIQGEDRAGVERLLLNRPAPSHHESQ